MHHIWNNQKAAQEIVNRLTSEDIVKLLFVDMDEIERQDDGSLTMRHRNVAEDVFENADDQTLPYDKEALLKYYNSGDVIVLLEADIGLINTVRTDLGLWAEHESEGGESGQLEAYAIAYAEANGLPNHFSYTVPKLSDIEVSSDDVIVSPDLVPIESEDQIPDGIDSEDKKPRVHPEPRTMRDFQIDRWVRFLQWMGNIELHAQRLHATAKEYEARAAADDKLPDFTAVVGSQPKVIDLSYNDAWVKRGNDPAVKCVFDRTWIVNYAIYTAHSFTNKHDYYLVDCNSSTTPNNLYDEIVYYYYNGDKHDTHVNAVAGHTSYLEMAHYIDDGKMGTDEVYLQDGMPHNVNHVAGHSDGITTTIGATLGFNGAGGTGGFSYGTSHTVSSTWDAPEYETSKKTDPDIKAVAKWRIDMDLFNDDSRHKWYDGHGNFLGWYWGVVTSSKPSANKELDLHCQWMWEASEKYWQKNSNPKMTINFGIGDGWQEGRCYPTYKGSHYYHSACNGAVKEKFNRSFALWTPPHVVIVDTEQNVELKDPKATDLSFGFYCNTDWVVETNADWCKVSSGHTTGSDTGGKSAFPITLRIDRYEYTGSLITREAVVKVRETRENGDTAYFTILQHAPHVVASKKEINATIDGGEFSFDILSDGDWTVVSDKSWCKIKETSSAGDKTGDTPRTITFTVNSAWGLENEDQRQAVITVTNKDTGETWLIYVKQPQTVFRVSETNFEADAEGGEASFTLWCDKGWTVESNQDWCVINETDKSGGDTHSSGRKITFNVVDGWASGNTDTRNAVITVKKPSMNQSAQITVTQSGYPKGTVFFSVSQTSFTAENLEGETMSFDLWCNKDWTVSSDSDWCVIASSDKSGGDTGKSGKKITFTVASFTPTPDDLTRKAIITVKQGSTGETIKVEVTQELILSHDINPYAEYIPLGQDLHFTLHCNTNWTIESDSDWCRVISSSSGDATGKSGKRIEMRIDPQPLSQSGTQPRTAIITMKAILPDGTVPKTVTYTLKQNGWHYNSTTDM